MSYNKKLKKKNGKNIIETHMLLSTDFAGSLLVCNKYITWFATSIFIDVRKNVRYNKIRKVMMI
jgi:hypothetical protein